jgi:hypothetical protein
VLRLLVALLRLVASSSLLAAHLLRFWVGTLGEHDNASWDGRHAPRETPELDGFSAVGHANSAVKAVGVVSRWLHLSDSLLGLLALATSAARSNRFDTAVVEGRKCSPGRRYSFLNGFGGQPDF